MEWTHAVLNDEQVLAAKRAFDVANKQYKIATHTDRLNQYYVRGNVNERLQAFINGRIKDESRLIQDHVEFVEGFFKNGGIKLKPKALLWRDSSEVPGVHSASKLFPKEYDRMRRYIIDNFLLRRNRLPQAEIVAYRKYCFHSYYVWQRYIDPKLSFAGIKRIEVQIAEDIQRTAEATRRADEATRRADQLAHECAQNKRLIAQLRRELNESRALEKQNPQGGSVGLFDSKAKIDADSVPSTTADLASN